MPDIAELTKEIEHLTRIVTAWNTAIIVLMVCAAASASGLVVAQRWAFKYGEKLAFASGELASLKESIADGKTAKALQAGAEANERATHAEGGVTEAKTEAARATTRATEAQMAQQRVQIELAKQQERAAHAEKSLVELQARVQWRKVTTKQEAEFVELTSDVPKGPLRVIAMDGDPESVAFAQNLAAMFEKAGWNPAVSSTLPIGSTPVGLFLHIRSKAKVTSSSPLYHAAILEIALEKIGIQSFADEIPELPDGQADLYVGHKP